MKYMLDVSALVAFGLRQHEFHARVAGWVYGLESNGIPELATCSITELGFVRVLAQVPEYGFAVADGRKLLLQLKSGATPQFTFLTDDQDILQLPAWVKAGSQTTDGHLVQVAASLKPELA